MKGKVYLMALKRYGIWDKVSPVITPSGEVFTAEEWKERYPVAAMNNIVVVCGAGEMNGAFFGTLGQMVHTCEAQGADFSEATTNIEKLEVIEAFEDARNHPVDTGESTPEERIAAALEYANLLNSPVVNPDDPDLDEE